MTMLPFRVHFFDGSHFDTFADTADAARHKALKACPGRQVSKVKILKAQPDLLSHARDRAISELVADDSTLTPASAAALLDNVETW